MMHRLFFLAFILFSYSCSSQKPQGINIIPQPSSVQEGKGNFIISKSTVIAVQDEGDRKAAEFFNAYLQKHYGFELDIDKQEGKDYIRLSTKKFIKAPDNDAYQLDVSSAGVTISGDTYAATFYGIQSLIQLLPVPTTGALSFNEKLIIPQVSIRDEPRFKYRGMHLDVARHFFDVAFVKKYIDYLAYHKLNYFHWHLTDDQGWRIEIKKYPELMQTAAWREGTIIGRFPGTSNDNTRYGGYYTQEEIREVVAYAAARYITVIPEIEMPGHASAAIAAFPWLSCFPEKPTVIPTHPSAGGKQKQASGTVKLVQESWGIFEDVFCAGKDSTFIFLQGVIDEVLELFPSPYIHVGGDECPKAHWKKCPRCQERIKKEGLKDEHELQSYFVQRMEKYINSKGRTIIGWDEILEGGLAPNAIVMSWRGEKGGIEAARQDHQVIMTPQKPLYFDHTQTRNEDSVVIGGFNPLEAVYDYDPLPAELPSDKHKYIMGAQANLWAEYIRYPSRVEYMVFPRMSALSEILWSSKSHRNWKLFEKKLMTQFRRYDLWNAHYSKAYYDLKVSILPTKNNNGVTITAEPRDSSGRIELVKYNASPLAFSNPLTITNSSDISINYVIDNKTVNSFPLRFSFNKATGKKVSITKSPNSMYPGQGGAFSLVNGIISPRGLGYPDWMGWIGDDMVATIDLGKTENISTVRLHTLDQNGSWIYLPKYVEVLVSADGKNYRPVGKSSEFEKEAGTWGWVNVNFTPVNTRYVKVIAKNNGVIAEGKPGGGNKAWVFASEIQIN